MKKKDLKKLKFIEDMGTFTEAYNERIATLTREFKSVGVLKTQLIEFQNECTKSLRDGLWKNNPVELYDMRKKIEALKEQIKHIESMKPIYDYLFDVIPYIQRFNTELITERTSSMNHNLTNADCKQQNITSTSIVEVTGTKGLGTLFCDYLVNVENVKPKNYKEEKTNQEICHYCECETNFIIFDRSATRVCQNCGNSETYQREDNSCFTYKDETENMTHLNQFAYKRSNHFLDWINSLESKLVKDIPQDVLVSLRYELKKLRITTLEEITPKLVRSLLKKQHLNKYYEHCNAITCELSGRQPLQLPEELKERLKKMFNMLQEPFELHKPKTRKNFLSYSYVIHKSLQLLNRDDLLPYFSLLKSREKLQVQDQIWAKICQHLQWEFIKSI